MRGRQVRAVMREARAPLRLLAQIRRIDPDPGIRFSGNLQIIVSPAVISASVPASLSQSLNSLVQFEYVLRLGARPSANLERIACFSESFPHGPSSSMPRARLFGSFITGKGASEIVQKYPRAGGR